MLLCGQEELNSETTDLFCSSFPIFSLILSSLPCLSDGDGKQTSASIKGCSETEKS